jgi:hypothetical protein
VNDGPQSENLGEQRKWKELYATSSRFMKTHKITGDNTVSNADDDYPATFTPSGGLWVDYNLETNLLACLALGENVIFPIMGANLLVSGALH